MKYGILLVDDRNWLVVSVIVSILVYAHMAMDQYLLIPFLVG